MVPMKIGIDSYCYHRDFGEVYAGLETASSRRMDIRDFVDVAHALGVEGVSLESAFVPALHNDALDELRIRLDRLSLYRVWAWGHPSGLHSGRAPEQLDDLKRHVEVAERLQAPVMRICCGGRRTRIDDWPMHKAGLLPLLHEAAACAQQHHVVLAIENHIDFLADELVDLIETVGSPWLGVCLDTANNLRMLEDPMEVVRKLAPHARATHIKDVAPWRGSPRDFAFWASVPLGRGLIDIGQTCAMLDAAGYDGLLALEIDFLHPDHGDIDAAVKASIDHLWRVSGRVGVS